MAYLAFAEGGAGPMIFANRAVTAVPQHDVAVAFDPLEWSIVALARQDPVSSIREEGLIGRTLRMIFGLKRRNPLADPRLEALRRLAVLGWHRGFAVPTSAVKAFLAAGYSPDHYEMLLGHISHRRAARPRRFQA